MSKKEIVLKVILAALIIAAAITALFTDMDTWLIETIGAR